MSLTLVGTKLAKRGTEFVYRGEADGCEDCPYRKQCLNLQPYTRYRITDVRDGGEILDCQVHREGVLAVDVEPASFEANVRTKEAYAGSKVSLPGPCPHTDCPSYDLCEPLGAGMDREYQIGQIIGEPPHESCQMNRSLTKVTLSPTDT